MQTFFAIAALLLLLPGICSHAAALELRTAAQNSPPKYYLRDDGSKGGICVDILNALEKLDTELLFSGYQQFLPFKRLQLYLETGELDVFFGLKDSDERLQKYVFSNKPLYRLNYVVAVRVNDNIEVESIDDIRGIGNAGVVLTVLGSAAGRFLHDQGGLEVNDSSPTPERMIRALLADRGRFAFYHDRGLQKVIRDEALEQEARILPVSFSSYHHYAAYSKFLSRDLVRQIDNALQNLHDNGAMAAIRRKYGLAD